MHTYHRFGVYLYIPYWCNFPGDLRWRSLAVQLNLPTSQAPFIINYQKIYKRFLSHEPNRSSRNHSAKRLTGPHLFGSPSSRPPVLLSAIFRSDDTFEDMLKAKTVETPLHDFRCDLCGEQNMGKNGLSSKSHLEILLCRSSADQSDPSTPKSKHPPQLY